jgi:hypothetical protein
MIISLGCRSPGISCNLPGSIERAALIASLFGLAPNGVCRAVHVTINAVSSCLALSPLPDLHRAVCFLWHFPPVTRSSCYEPSCPVEFGLSSPAHRPERSCTRSRKQCSSKVVKLKGKRFLSDLLSCFFRLVVYDALASRAFEDLVSFQQHVVLLGWDIHEAALTDPLDDIDDGKTFAPLA